MATWTAKCWLGSANGYQDLTVQSNTHHGAKEQLERIYGAEQIINLREVRQGSSSGSSSDVDFGSIFALGALMGGAYVFMVATPWVLMIGGAGVGIKLGKWSQRLWIGLVASLMLGSVGWIEGTKLQETHFDSVIEEIHAE